MYKGPGIRAIRKSKRPTKKAGSVRDRLPDIERVMNLVLEKNPKIPNRAMLARAISHSKKLEVQVGPGAIEDALRILEKEGTEVKKQETRFLQFSSKKYAAILKSFYDKRGFDQFGIIKLISEEQGVNGKTIILLISRVFSFFEQVEGSEKDKFAATKKKFGIPIPILKKLVKQESHRKKMIEHIPLVLKVRKRFSQQTKGVKLARTLKRQPEFADLKLSMYDIEVIVREMGKARSSGKKRNK